MLEFVNLAVRGRSRVDYAAGADFERLHLQFLRLKNNGCVAFGRNPVDARGGSGRGVNIARVIRTRRPDVGGWRGVEQLEGRSQFQAARAANGDAGSRPFGEVFEFRLLPGAGTVGKNGGSDAEDGDYCK